MRTRRCTPAFGFQPTIGVLAADPVSSRPDTRLFARCFRLQFNLVALFFSPTHIHARQNAGPIAAFSAARACVDFQEGVVAVGLTVQQGLKLFARGQFDQGLQAASASATISSSPSASPISISSTLSRRPHSIMR